MNSCPKCKNVGGVLMDVVMSAVRFESWGGEDIDTDNYTLKSEKNFRCADCGHKMTKAKVKKLQAAATAPESL